MDLFQRCPYPSISDDGRLVAFYSYATNLVPGDTNRDTDIFVHDRGLVEPFLVQGALIRSQGTWFQVQGAQAGEWVYFLVSPTGLGTGPCPIGLGGLCLDLLLPVLPFGIVAANSAGVAFLEGTVPTWPPLTALYTQAVIPRGLLGADSVKTNPVAAPVYP